MTLKIFIASAMSAGALVCNVSAGELADACVAALEAEDRDTSGCACLEEEIAGNEALAEEFIELGEIADPEERFEAASEDAQAAMTKCTR